MLKFTLKEPAIVVFDSKWKDPKHTISFRVDSFALPNYKGPAEIEFVLDEDGLRTLAREAVKRLTEAVEPTGYVQPELPPRAENERPTE